MKSKPFTSITTVTALLTVRSPLHVGSAGSGPGEPAAVLRDGAGRLILPGTSIAGVLRARLGRDELTWGGTEQGASRVIVHDAVFIGAQASGRDGVAIDRALGSAVDGLLYHREAVPAGATATLRIEVRSTAEHESADRALLADLQVVLRRGDLAFGARTTRGLGRVAVTGWAVHEVRYDEPAAFWRTRTAPDPVTLPAPSIEAPDLVTVTVAWRPNGPVFVSAGGLHSGRADDSLGIPLVEPDPDDATRVRQVLPGTSIAGALRARAELVCRTLGDGRVPDGFAEQLASAPLAQLLFGGPAARAGVASVPTTASPLAVDDCAACSGTDTAQWVAFVTGNALRQELAGAGELRRTTHVAIDRWTGGAAEGLLYQVIEPHAVPFAPIVLRLDRSRIPADEREAATMLLLITVRELAEGRIPLGQGTHRGHGDLTVDSVHVTGGGLSWEGKRLDLGHAAFAELRRAWRSWWKLDGEDAA